MPEPSLAKKYQNLQKRRLKVDINNDTAAEIVRQLQVQLVTSFEMIATIMRDQNQMLQRALAANGSGEVLEALKEQNALLSQLIERPVKMAPGTVNVKMPNRRPSRFEFEFNSQGVPVALIAMEDE